MIKPVLVSREVTANCEIKSDIYSLLIRINLFK